MTAAEPLVIDGWDFSDPMRPGEVADLWRVDPKTVGRWADEGKVASFRTAGQGSRSGNRRYSRQQMDHLLAEGYCPATATHGLPVPGGERS